MNPNEKLNYVKNYLLNELNNNPNFVIDGNATTIGDVEIKDIMDIDFDDNLEDELLYVHATDYTPTTANAIVSTESTNRKVIGIGGEHASHRITVHGTLNTLVKSNNGGNWDSRKYTVVTPFSKIDSKVAGLGAGDTFFIDKVKLTDETVILVPESEKDNLTEEDLKHKIIFFKGDYSNAISQAIAMLGYKPQTYSESSILNYNNATKINNYRISHGYGPSLHSETMYRLVENILGKRDIAVSEIRGRNVNTCLEKETTIAEIEEIFNKRLRKFYDTKEQIIEFLLDEGISFDAADTPRFLDTHETLDRLEKYYNQEANCFIVNPSNISEYPEVANLYNTYTRLVNEKDLGKDNYTSLQQLADELDRMDNDVELESELYSKMETMTKEKLLKIDFVQDYKATIQSLFEGSDLTTRIMGNGIMLKYKDLKSSEDSNTFRTIFPGCKQQPNYSSIDHMFFEFDRSKTVIDNLKEIYDEIVEVYKTLRNNGYLNKVEETELNAPSGTGLRM